MPTVTLRGPGIAPVVARPGETLVFGRAPHAALPPGGVPGRILVVLPDCSPHVSRLIGELVVSGERVVLNWLGSGAGQLAGLFDAPGGARRVAMTRSLSAQLDEGENQLVLLLGRHVDGQLSDLQLTIEVEAAAVPDPPDAGRLTGSGATAAGPALERGGREWFVALALAEPWLTGRDDYPRPPSNREIYDRVLGWHGYAWNLERPQRVDDIIRVIAVLSFGPADNPTRTQQPGRLQNTRFAVARRIAELGLVTAADLAEVERAAHYRKLPPG